jgi:glycerol uptake facilitator-like aquaporin
MMPLRGTGRWNDVVVYWVSSVLGFGMLAMLLVNWWRGTMSRWNAESFGYFSLGASFAVIVSIVAYWVMWWHR